MDKDIVDTQKHIDDAEKKHGKWKIDLKGALVQLESDPICSSAGCEKSPIKPKNSHPMDYFVPNFGQDHDVLHNFNSLDWAEKSLDHKWLNAKKGKPKDPIIYDDSRPLDTEI